MNAVDNRAWERASEPKFNTNHLFQPGKLTTILDGQAGSSGKGVIGSFVTRHADNWTFACNAFSAQAGHWVRPDVDRKFFYQTLNSCAYDPSRCEKIYIGPDAAIELAAFLREVEENNVAPAQIGLSPLAVVIQDKDMAYERGEVNFDGVSGDPGEGTIPFGSTCHGVGAARARRVLRRKDVLLARDVPVLSSFLCKDPGGEVMERLDRGEAGLLEIAQGFQLSLLSKFYPHVTSRNVTVAAGLDGMMVAPRYAGHTVLNFRTFPIRIASKKYLDPSGRHLTWADVEARRAAGEPVQEVPSPSGGWYSDQHEVSWEDVTKQAGSDVPIREITSVTKLPRRVATFSIQNLLEAIRHNRPPAGNKTFLSVNFVNYVDARMAGRRGVVDRTHDEFSGGPVTYRVHAWLESFVRPAVGNSVMRYISRLPWEPGEVELFALGTGPLTDDKIQVNTWPAGY